MAKDKEIIDIIPTSDEAPLSSYQFGPGFDPEKALVEAEKRIEFLDKLKTATLKMTRAKDWVAFRGQGGKANYYPQATGVEKLCRVWGIYWKDLQIEKINDEGKPAFEVMGTIGSKVLDAEVQYIGGRSAGDDFFNNQEKLDILDVRKAAVSNWVARATMALLGLRNVSADDLKSVDINPDSIQGFKFKEGYKGHSEDELTPELKETRKKIGEMILDMANGDKELAKDLLRDITRWTNKEGKDFPGKSSVKDLTPRQIPVIYGKVKIRYEAEFAGAKDD